MNRTDKNLVKTRLTDVSQIKCGMLVAFAIGKDEATGKNILVRGFIRQINQGYATIPAGNGTYRVKIDPEVIRYELTRG